MQNHKWNRILGLALAALFCLGPRSLWAEVPDWVPENYGRFFHRSVDDRPLWNKALSYLDVQVGETGQSFALIVGVSKYPKMTGRAGDLGPARIDVEKMVAYVERPPESFNEVVVLLDEDVTAENLRFFLTNYFPRRLSQAPNSRFLFAYSGHGMTATGARGYLLTSQATNLTDRFAGGISFATLRAQFQEIVESGHQVLALINACYGGEFSKSAFGNPPSTPTRKGAHAITAGGTDELTWHDPAFGEGSIFFEAVIAGVEGRADKLPEDGIVTINELETYLKATISRFTDEKQNPRAGDLDPKGSPGGFFFLSRDRQITEKNVEALTGPWWAGQSFGSDQSASQCDRLAGYPTKDYWRSTQGARFDEIKTKEAIAACRLAIREFPNEQRFNFQLGRALHASKSYDDAIWWYRKSAKFGNTDAMTNIGRMHSLGEGVKQDFAEALKWYQAAADQGNARAMFELGWAYYAGEGVIQDLAEAMKRFRQAAAAGDPNAMYNLGWMYDNGEGVVISDTEAAKWYRQAAEAGDTGAMNNLGVMYDNGEGVARDLAEAMKWFRQAAEAGDPNGMYNLGRMYDFGREVPTDYFEAAKWYNQAADDGDGDAAHTLAESYDKGRWGLPDYQLAGRYLLKALKLKNANTEAELADGLHNWNNETRIALQNMLRDMGYFTGPVDGVIDTNVREAVATYVAAE